MRYLIAFLALLASNGVIAQISYPPSGSPNGISKVSGGLIAGDSFSQVAPKRDTTAWFSRKSDFIRMPGSNRLFFFDGQSYREVTGPFDSSAFYNALAQRVKYSDTSDMLLPFERVMNKANDLSIPNSNLYPTTKATKDNDISSAVVSGTNTKVITLSRPNGDITATWTDINTVYSNGFGLGLAGTVFYVDTTKVPTLDPGGKIPLPYMPASLMIYKGVWNPVTNAPTLVNGTGTAGWVYKASWSGGADSTVINLGGGNITFYKGDFVLYNGTAWERSVGTDNVVSVNGKQGVVLLRISDIPGLQDSITAKEPVFAKGNLVAGSNVTLGGTLTNRLVGSGNVTISSTVPAGYVQFSDTLTTIATKKNLRDTAASIRSSLSLYELLANKVTNFNTANNTLYPTTAAVANKFSNGTNIAGQLKFLNNPDQFDLSPANMDWMWHDQFAFGRNISTWETTTDFGSNWTAGTVNLGIFNQKQNDPTSTVLLTNTSGSVNGLRIKWTGFGFGQLNWIITQLNYTGATCYFNMLVEESSDNVNFTTLATYTGLQQAGATTAAWRTPQATANYTRVTFTINNGLSPAGATATLKNLRGMALRAGDQGGGKEVEYPYSWTNDRYMRFATPVYTPASGSATLPSNYSIALINTSNAGELTRASLANVLQGQGFAMADSTMWQTKYRSDTARTNTYGAIALKANDNAVVHLAGTETITGAKTFSASPLIPAGATSTAAVNKSQLDAGLASATDSTVWQTKYRSDTARTNVYNALVGKVNLTNGSNNMIINGADWTIYGIPGNSLGLSTTAASGIGLKGSATSNSFVFLKSDSVTVNRTLQLPDTPGVVALRVNGQMANKYGSITIPVGTGTVTSVGMTVPTGLSISGSPITTTGTLAVGLQSGYSIPTVADQATWTAGYNDKVNSASFSGTSTKTLTLTQQDGGTVTAAFTDADTPYTAGTNISIAGHVISAATPTWQQTLTAGNTGDAFVVSSFSNSWQTNGYGIFKGAGSSPLSMAAGTAYGINLRAGTYGINLNTSGLTADRNVTFPDKSGTVAYTDDCLPPSAVAITGVAIGNGTSLTGLASSTAKQILRRDPFNAGYEWWSPDFMSLYNNGQTMAGNGEILRFNDLDEFIIDEANKINISTDEDPIILNGNGGTILQPSTGNVGIGTSSPSGRLETVTTGTAAATVIDSYSDYTDAVYFSNSSSALKNALVMRGKDDGIGTAIESGRENPGGNWNTYLSFYTNNVTGGSTTAIQEKVRITGSGNVGIGTSSPAQKLHVDGTIRQTNVIDAMIKADNNGDLRAAVAGTDYVAPAYLAGGAYTPTISGSGSFTPAGFTYTKVGNVVSVTGRVSCTGLGSFTNNIIVSLPVACDVPSATDVIGTVSGNGLNASPNYVTGDTGTDQALVTFTSTSGTSATVYIHFQYLIQ